MTRHPEGRGAEGGYGGDGRGGGAAPGVNEPPVPRCVRAYFGHYVTWQAPRPVSAKVAQSPSSWNRTDPTRGATRLFPGNCQGFTLLPELEPTSSHDGYQLRPLVDHVKQNLTFFGVLTDQTNLKDDALELKRKSLKTVDLGRSGNMHWSPALRTRSGVVGRGYGVETDCRMEYCT
ncbi:hypothetical protein J6590_026245 [Homalodisca vitripennis]|nr:hypothetical protein J6590_026245 [Homalodisca vitripennis]